ncbi:hypothetical protein ABE10_01925, partial [Bacillus toyonensis]|nr:hypothetical protein [Bacillus toyonensis]
VLRVVEDGEVRSAEDGRCDVALLARDDGGTDLALQVGVGLDQALRGPRAGEHHGDVALAERVTQIGLLPRGRSRRGEAVLGGQVGVELDARLRLLAVELARPGAVLLGGDLAAGAPDPGVDLELGVTGDRERHHVGLGRLDGLAGLDDVVPALRCLQAQLLEDVGAVHDRADARVPRHAV